MIAGRTTKKEYCARKGVSGYSASWSWGVGSVKFGEQVVLDDGSEGCVLAVEWPTSLYPNILVGERITESGVELPDRWAIPANIVG